MGLPLQHKPLGYDFGKVRIHGGASRFFQAKLAISQPGDKYEREANRVAEQVMRMPEPRLQRQTAPVEEEEIVQTEPLLQRQGDSGVETPSEAPAMVHEVLHSPGRPLAATTRAFMEPRFGYNFGRVRVHTDTRAAESARILNAQAFTVGRDIVFGSGQYMPTTPGGKRLLGHELSHVVQQSTTAFREKGMVNESSEAPSIQFQTIGTPCGSTQPVVDNAFTRASSMIGLALSRLGLIKIDKKGEYVQHLISIENVFGTGVRGDDIQRIMIELQSIRAKIKSPPPQQCVPASDPSCLKEYMAFVDPDDPNGIFFCPIFFNSSNSPDQRALKVIHEASHVIHKDRHDGFDTDDEGMVFKCGIEMGITFSQALNNAYAYETLVGCLTGTMEAATGGETLTRKEMRRQKKLLNQEEK